MPNSQLSKGKLNKYALLRHKKYRDKENLFIVQGEKAVKDTCKCFKTEAIIIEAGKTFGFIQGQNNVYEASKAELRKISTLENIPEIIAVYHIPYNQAAEVPTLPEGEFYLVLDGIQDPGNLGTIIRTAHWFGIKKLFCSHNTVDLYNPKAVMASMGSIANVNVTYCDLVSLFKANPLVPVYGLLLKGENIFKTKNLKPGFVLMGSEGHGPAEECLNYITSGLTIPPSDSDCRPDSLNVAVATAITLSQIIQ